MGRLFFGGVPTDNDVKSLVDQLNVGSGASISYTTITGIIGVDHRNSRFRTITNVWRKRMFRERGLQSVARAGEFRFLTAAEAVDGGIKKLYGVGKAVAKIHTRAVAINQTELTEDKLAKHGLLVRESNALLDHMRQSTKAIAAPKPVSPSLRLAK